MNREREKKERAGTGKDVEVLQNRNWVGFNVRDFVERAV